MAFRVRDEDRGSVGREKIFVFPHAHQQRTFPPGADHHVRTVGRDDAQGVGAFEFRKGLPNRLHKKRREKEEHADCRRRTMASPTRCATTSVSV
jgi:hypothetical protein